MKIMNNTKVKNLTILTFLLALTLAPALGFAKENENRKNDDKNKSNKENHLCLKAWGQFVRNGWKETKGEISLNANCRIPHGIFKKWNYNPATSTDMVAPVINSFTVSSENTKADVNWSANEKSRAVVFYGTTTPIVVKSATTTRGNLLESVSSTNAMTAVDNNILSTKGELTLKNLSASTTYYAVLAVRDGSGNVTVSNVVTFTTKNSTDTVAPIINNIFTTISSNKLFISWRTNESATSKLFYGTTTLDVNASTTANISKTTYDINHSFELPLLASTTPYHVILQSTDIVGNTQTSAEYSIYSPF